MGVMAVVEEELAHLVNRRGGVDGGGQAHAAYQVGQGAEVGRVGVGEEDWQGARGVGGRRGVMAYSLSHHLVVVDCVNLYRDLHQSDLLHLWAML
jgi:hypothetical protein